MSKVSMYADAKSKQ